jgi:hypothetical protein
MVFNLKSCVVVDTSNPAEMVVIPRITMKDIKSVIFEQVGFP